MPDVTVGGIGEFIQRTVVEPAEKWKEERVQRLIEARAQTRRYLVDNLPEGVLATPPGMALQEYLTMKTFQAQALNKAWADKVNKEGVEVGGDGAVVVDVQPRWRGDP